MADIATVIVKITDALDEAYLAAGLPTVTEQLAAKDTQIANLTSQLAAEQAKVANMLAAVTTVEAAVAAVRAAGG